MNKSRKTSKAVSNQDPRFKCDCCGKMNLDVRERDDPLSEAFGESAKIRICDKCEGDRNDEI